MISLEEQFEKAEQGKELWNAIKKEGLADWYLVMPEERSQYNYYALLYLKDFMKKQGLNKIRLLSVDKNMITIVKVLCSDVDVKVQILNQEEMMCFMKYYALYEFTSRITIASLKIPYDTYGENLIGVKGITKEDLFCFDIYRFNETLHKQDFSYLGEDKLISNFIAKKGEY